MKKYTYYTPIDLARNLLGIIPQIEAKSIVDICCGSWNLLQAGREKYPNAIITGVDIDKNSEKYKIDRSFFVNDDGREFAKKAFKIGKTYDLILSNPPLGYMEKKEIKYKNDMEINGDCYPKLLNKRYECEMMQANMLLAHDDSVLIFILPYTFIAGISFQETRAQIADNYSVLAIIKLPSTTFEKGKINTFAIVIQRKMDGNPTKMYYASCDDAWHFKMIGEMDRKEIKKGNWWFTKSDFNDKKIKIFRGNVSSDMFQDSGQIVLHCATKKNERWQPSIRFYDASKMKKEVAKAKRGDVLINRIGKDAGYWYINEDDNIPISDCLLVISNVTKPILNIMEKNSNTNGRLNVPMHGVTTTYITAKDVLELFHGDEKERDK